MALTPASYHTPISFSGEELVAIFPSTSRKRIMACEWVLQRVKCRSARLLIGKDEKARFETLVWWCSGKGWPRYTQHSQKIERFENLQARRTVHGTVKTAVCSCNVAMCMFFLASFVAPTASHGVRGPISFFSTVTNSSSYEILLCMPRGKLLLSTVSEA